MFSDLPKKRRDFEYKKPSTYKEYIKSMYEELAFSTKNELNESKVDTLRDQVEKISFEILKIRMYFDNKEETTKQSEDASHITVGILGPLLMIIASNAGDTISYLKDNQAIIFLFGLVLSTAFVFLSIEKSSIIKNLWKYWTIKFFASSLFALMIINCRSSAAAIINGIFGVDASLFPFTLSIMTGIMLIKSLFPIFIAMAISSLFHALTIYLNFKNNDHKLKPWLFFICTLFSGLYTSITLSKNFNDENLRIKSYKLAHHFDFSPRTYCSNNKNISVIFLGQQNNRYLVDEKININEDAKDFIQDKALDPTFKIPDSFLVETCHD